MAGQTTLPIPKNTTDVVTFAILSGEKESEKKEVPQTIRVKSLTITKEFNRIPYAQLTLLDGDPGKQSFDTSNQEYFIPGKTIIIQVGYGGKNTTLFEGIVVEHNLSFRTGGKSNLEVVIQDKAVKMTLNPKSRYFTQLSDSSAISNILAEYKIDNDIPNTLTVHPEIVQYQVTDWDFIMARAEINSLLCKVESGKLHFMIPKVAEEPLAQLDFGTNIIDFDINMDARDQFSGIQVRAWDQEKQKTDILEAVPSPLAEAGNISAEALSKAMGENTLEMIHSGDVDTGELQSWADSRMMRQKLAKFRGRIKCKGFPGIAPGVTIRVSGIGGRFNGDAIVTGVRHEVYRGGWYSHIQLGLDPRPYTTQYPIHAAPAAGLVAGVPGLQIGVVTQLSGDPEGKDRILVRIPVINNQEEGTWARLASVEAGNGRGFVFRPEIGDEVVLGFLQGDPRDPIVLGALHSSINEAPIEALNENHYKGYTSRSKMQIHFDDEKSILRLSTDKGNVLELNEETGQIRMEDQNGNLLQMNAEGIILESKGKIHIKASGDIKVEGSSIAQDARSSLSASGRSGASLTSGGITEVKGSIVNIN